MKDWGHFKPYMTIVSLMKWNENSHNSINKWKFQLKTNQFLIKIWNIIIPRANAKTQEIPMVISSESFIVCQNAKQRQSNKNLNSKLNETFISSK